MNTPKPSRGWSPDGTATGQRAAQAKRALLAWMREREQPHACRVCDGQGFVVEMTVQAPGVRRWLVPVVCPNCRQEDAAR